MQEVRLIDGTKLEKEIDDAIKEAHDDFNYVAAQLLEIIKQVVKKQPTIEAEPVRHGRWEYRHADDWMFCTACGADAEGNYDEPLETDYCPHCGARMDGGADS